MTPSPRASALLLAAGLGTRLRPLTDHAPKCLIPIAGQPVLDDWLEALDAAGVTHGIVNAHTHLDQMRWYCDSVANAGRFDLSIAFEKTLLGSAGTISANPNLADHADQIIVIYVDNLSDVDLAKMLEFHRAHGDPATMLLFRAPNPKACGIAKLDAAGRVVSFIEKPQNPESDLANAGVYIFSAAAYREIAEMRAFDLGFDVLPRFVGRMRGWLSNGYHRDIGTLDSLAQVRADAPTVRAKRAARGPSTRPAVFLDRDGTVIEHVHYISDPERVRLLPGVAEGLAKLRAAGFALVVVTNQSGVGRGYFTEERLADVHAEMNRQLEAAGAPIDHIEYCTDVPPRDDDRATITSARRKPGPGMLIDAARSLQLDLRRSWMIGDMVSDLLCGANAKCRGSILVGTGKGLDDDERRAAPNHLSAATLDDAARLIIEGPWRGLCEQSTDPLSSATSPEA